MNAWKMMEAVSRAVKSLLILLSFLALAAALAAGLALLGGCTVREVSYHGVNYRHQSFGTKQTFGEMNVSIATNGTATVNVKNFANDQTTILHEATELLQQVNKLKAP